MEHIRKQQLWRDITGRVLDKEAELAETYDMTSQQRASALKPRTFPIKKTGAVKTALSKELMTRVAERALKIPSNSQRVADVGAAMSSKGTTMGRKALTAAQREAAEEMRWAGQGLERAGVRQVRNLEIPVTKQVPGRGLFGSPKLETHMAHNPAVLPGMMEKSPDIGEKILNKMSSADDAVKEAFLGIGIPIDKFSDHPDKPVRGEVSVGIPYGIGVSARHKPSGFGGGIGLTGPYVSWSPGTITEWEQGKNPERMPQMTAPKPHVDVTSQEPPTMVQEKKAQRYALPAQGRYPLDSYAQVKEAAVYFGKTFKFMPPPDRHEYAENLTKRAHQLGIFPGEVAEKYGASTYAPYSDIEVCLDARRNNLQDEVHLDVLDKLAELRNVMRPEDFALALHEFDKVAMLDQHYGYIPDAYYTTFGKTAEQAAEASPSEAVVIGNEYITRRRLGEYLSNNASSLETRFGGDVAKELAKDPQGIFDSLPRDQKLVIMRMANNDDSPVQQGE